MFIESLREVVFKGNTIARKENYEEKVKDYFPFLQ